MWMRLFSGNTFRSAATVPGCDHLPEAPVPSSEYAVAMKKRIVGRRRIPDGGGDAEAGVRTAKATSAANSIRRMGALPQVICNHSQIVTQGRSLPLPAILR